MNKFLGINNFKSVFGLIKSNSALAIVSHALRVGSALFVLPFALKILPQDLLGLNYTFTAITGLIALLDFGFSPTLSRFCSYAWSGAKEINSIGLPVMGAEHEPNIELYKRLVSVSRLFYLLVSIAAFILLATIGTEYLKSILTRDSISLEYLGCWLLLIFGSCYGTATGFYSVMLNGIGGVREGLINQIIAQLLYMIILVTLLYMGLNLWSYGWAGLIVGICHVVIGRKFLFKRTDVKISDIPFISSFELLKSFWPNAWRFALIMLSGYIINRANTIICTSRFGLSETGSYGLTLQALTVILAVAFAPLSVLWPKLNMLSAKGEISNLLKLFYTRLYLGVLFYVFALIIFSIICNPLLDLIGSKSTILPISLTLVLGLVMLFESHSTNWATLVFTSNVNPFVTMSIITSLCVLVASWYLSGLIGLVGLVLGQGLCQLICSYWYPTYYFLNYCRHEK